MNQRRVSQKAIHIEAKAAVAVQASTTRQFSSEYAVCIPSSSWGSEYMVSSFRNYEEHYTGFHQSEFVVVCGPEAVQVEITTSCPTLKGQKGSFNVDLEPGEYYVVRPYENKFGDLTGSTIKATDGTSKFIVYQGHEFTKVATKKCEQSASGDPLYETALPIDSWGNNFVLVRPEMQYLSWYRVVSSEDSCDNLPSWNICQNYS